MSLAPGVRLGAYEVVALIGSGQRFLFLKAAAAASVGSDASQRLMFVERWFEELKQRVPTQ